MLTDAYYIIKTRIFYWKEIILELNKVMHSLTLLSGLQIIKHTGTRAFTVQHTVKDSKMVFCTSSLRNFLERKINSHYI